jgi:hypothetical protein
MCLRQGCDLPPNWEHTLVQLRHRNTFCHICVVLTVSCGA